MDPKQDNRATFGANWPAAWCFETQRTFRILLIKKPRYLSCAGTTFQKNHNPRFVWGYTTVSEHSCWYIGQDWAFVYRRGNIFHPSIASSISGTAPSSLACTISQGSGLHREELRHQERGGSLLHIAGESPPRTSWTGTLSTCTLRRRFTTTRIGTRLKAGNITTTSGTFTTRRTAYAQVVQPCSTTVHRGAPELPHAVDEPFAIEGDKDGILYGQRRKLRGSSWRIGRETSGSTFCDHSIIPSQR